MRRRLVFSIIGLVISVVPSAIFLMYVGMITGVYVLHWGAVSVTLNESLTEAWFWWWGGEIRVFLIPFIVGAIFFPLLLIFMFMFRRERRTSKLEKEKQRQKQKDVYSGMVVWHVARAYCSLRKRRISRRI